MNVCLFTSLPANNATFQDLYFDTVHPSLKGTYLQGLIITGAITGNLLYAYLKAQYGVIKGLTCNLCYAALLEVMNVSDCAKSLSVVLNRVDCSGLMSYSYPGSHFCTLYDQWCIWIDE